MKNIKRWAAILAIATGITAVCGSAVLADDETDTGPSSDVWLTVVRAQTTNRISVTVPMAYGFAVVGTTDASDTTGISYENGNLMLPNVRVEKPDRGGEEATGNEYVLTFTGDTKLLLRNYSTVADENAGDTGDLRSGLAVTLNAYMDYRDRNGTLISQAGSAKGWEMTDQEPTNTEADYKKFRILLDGKEFHTPSAQEGNENSRLVMDGQIHLEAPPDVEANGWTSAGTASIPSEKEVGIHVQVGGQRGQYTQVEKSVKAAMIHWDVEPVYEGNGESGGGQ